MKKEKWLKNYYTKLTLLSTTMVLLLVAVVAVVLLLFMHSENVTHKQSEYDMALKELSEVYKDIYGNYYEIFMPLNNDYNESCIKKFCSNDASPQEKPKVRQAFENVMLEVCQKDEHIYGVYFRRLSDDTRYLYVGEKQRMQEVSWKLNEEFIEQSYVRYMVGGRRLGEAKELLSLEEQISVFGIQSGIMPGERTAPELKYQITALYDTTFFDTILKKYDVSPEARFLITSSQGLIFYDSANVYGTGESYFEEIENVKGKEKEILLDDNVWVKNLVELSQNKFLAFYIVPQSSIIGFQLSGYMSLVILVAVAIIIMMFMVMLVINRFIRRRFCVLEDGMEMVGQNNLQFRFTVDQREDEFNRIALKFNQMCDDLEDMIHKNYVYQVLQQKAEYQALQTTVNPHFLYNSLESIRQKLEDGTGKEGAEMVVFLSRMFEYQIRGDAIVSIRMERNSMQNYIDFCSIRYAYAFEYDIVLSKDILDCMIPKLIFQPILENYFVHGFKGDGTDCIRIEGYRNREDDMIYICFCDNGKGVTPERARELNASMDKGEEDSSHIGLQNVHKRLQIVYGSASRVEVIPNSSGEGVTIQLVFSGEIKDLQRFVKGKISHFQKGRT